MNIESLRKKFNEKFNKMTDEEKQEFDNWFISIEDDLVRFYGIDECIENEEQREKFLDFLYMYATVHDKDEFDERYDQGIFNMAIEYAGIDTDNCK